MCWLQKYLLSTVLLLVFLELSYGKIYQSEINCYQCHSKYDEDCHNLAENSSVYLKPCVSSVGLPAPFCRKITQKIHGWEGKLVTLRKCGWVRHENQCYRVRNWDHSETVCQCFTDGCNLAISLGGLPCLLLPLTLLYMVLV